ncbi:mitochondrial ribosomal S6 [Chlorella sorokiniana]|uniref:Mitochondrial ribosomal S6 n=1 Tax=Chlorella sorokiniana TaxID=3076 RepID=A0A2P6TP53_CHLSO|nr:mitochondrial ribosomal S6 [Chlorella sorokiniana]|eukprot:PRW51089.1 mitochondrial ribosomal S6 [Chlorella sorokiniana]
MPFYELFALAKPGLGKQQLAQILRAVGQQVMEHGGVVTDIRSYGERRLAYDIRQPGARYSEAAMWQVNFAAKPTTLQELDHTLRVDERMLRWMVLKRRPYGPLPTPYQVARAAEHVAAPLARQQQQQQQQQAAAEATR